MSGVLGKFTSVWSSSIAKKLVVAVTGILLLLFLAVHMIGNLLIYVGADAINAYGEFLQHLLHGWGVWIARVGLLATVALHVVATIQLTRQNRAARGTAYAYKDTVVATKASRTMIYSGLLIFAFIVYHLLHFTITPDAGDAGYYDAESRHDIYAMLVTGFSNPLVSGVYILAMCLLYAHLGHGFSSIFQTLGLRTERNWPLIVWSGQAYALLILIGNCSIPVSVLAGLVK